MAPLVLLAQARADLAATALMAPVDLVLAVTAQAALMDQTPMDSVRVVVATRPHPSIKRTRKPTS